MGGWWAPSLLWGGRLYGRAGAEAEDAAMGGLRGDDGLARSGTSRRRGRVCPACRPVPARAAGALLPVPRLGARRRGRAAEHLAVGLAGPGWVRETRLGPRLAVPGRHEPVPGRASIGPPAAARQRATSRAGTARADPAG